MRSSGAYSSLPGWKSVRQILVARTEEVVEMRNGQKRRASVNFSLGYVSGPMEMNEASWHLVKDTTSRAGVIGWNG